MPAISIIASCYRAEAYLARFLAGVTQQSIFDRCELVLVHNEPSPPEIEVVRAFAQDHGDRLRHVVVDAREPLPRSWNRGIREARSGIAAMWNVDDVRTTNSLELQLAALEGDADAIATYGDFRVVRRFGETAGTLVTARPFDRHEFTRTHQVGPFPMFRIAACERAGLFDEQLMIAADYDFFIRLAFNGAMRPASGLLGYFLYAGEGLSSRADTLLPVERTVVELRYGMHDRLDYRYYLKARAYRSNELLFDGTWHPVQQFVPSYGDMLRRRSRTGRPLGYARFAFRVLTAPARAVRRRLRSS